MVFRNGLNYHYHFIIIKLAEEFHGQFQCPGENTEKRITSSVPIEKQESGKTKKYKIKFMNSVKFMASYLSSLAENLAEGLLKFKCKDCKFNLEYLSQRLFTNFKDF